MTCFEADRMLADFACGGLSPVLAWRLKRHLRRCHRCARVVEELRTVLAAMPEARRPSVPARLREETLAAARGRLGVPEREGGLGTRILMPAYAAGFFLVLSFGFQLWGSGSIDRGAQVGSPGVIDTTFQLADTALGPVALDPPESTFVSASGDSPDSLGESLGAGAQRRPAGRSPRSPGRGEEAYGSRFFQPGAPATERCPDL
jgi:hypothetical protein